MKIKMPHQDYLSLAETEKLINRMELWPKLLRRQQEELIIELVGIEKEWIAAEKDKFFSDKDEKEFLEARSWSKKDLELYITREEALFRFAKQSFGPGVEETFLSSQGSRDQVIYSLLRVRDKGLARELWIRLEEGEITFAEAAQRYSEGPESHRKGILGPTPIGLLQPPDLAVWLRSLQPGELMPPKDVGEWHVLLRLEKLSPAKLDEDMRKNLLNEKLDNFLEKRVQQLLKGKTVEPFHYDQDS